MILVVAEHKNNSLKPITNELIVFAQRLARDFSQPVAVAVLSSDVDSMAEDLKTRKIDRVIAVSNASLSDYNPHSYVAALKSIID
jgi:electron transfer flavoprotein alpha subunit